MQPEETPQFSCRPDQLMGYWAIHEPTFMQLFEQAIRIDPVALQEKNKENAKPKKEPYVIDETGVARMKIDGPMTKYPTSYSSLFGGTATMEKRKAIRDAANDPRVSSLALILDTPGGTVAGTAELGDEIAQARQKKPVYAIVEDQCCSAGYWAASQADYIFANRTAHVGSIGTTLRLYDKSGMYNREGIKAVPIDSGKFKSLGMTGREITEEDKQELQREINVINDQFLTAVSQGRGITKEAIKDFEARVFIGPEAKDQGLVDEVCSLEEALTKIKTTSIAGGRLAGGVQKAASHLTGSDDPRSLSMTGFTPQQVADLRKAFPSAAGVTEDQLPTAIAGQFVSQSNRLQEMQTENERLRNEVATLKSQVPTKLDSKVAEGHLSVFGKEMSIMLREGKIMPEQLEILKASMLSGDKPRIDLVAADGTIMLPAPALTKVLDLNKPKDLATVQTPTQVQERQVPESGSAPHNALPPQTKEEREALGNRVKNHLGAKAVRA